MTISIGNGLNTPHNNIIVVLYKVKISVSYNIILYNRKSYCCKNATSMYFLSCQLLFNVCCLLATVYAVLHCRVLILMYGNMCFT